MAVITRVGAIKRHFGKLRDPRVRGRSRHLLIDIMVLAICGVIGNCDDWPDIVLFAQKRKAWFKRFLKLPNGIPSHDTFERVFAHIDPRAFERCCVEWLSAAAELLGTGQIAIDGKTLRGSGNSRLGPLHLVSAWSVQANLTLGQVAVSDKGSEITAIPKLLELLDLKGALVTIDAIGCHKGITRAIVDKGGDYLITVKANQPKLNKAIQATVEQGLKGRLPAAAVQQHTTTEKGHGRQEKRTLLVIYIKDLKNIDSEYANWPKLTAIGMCRSERTINGKTTEETRYFIGSRRMSAAQYAKRLRKHWHVENRLHWQLDVSFSEDASRIQEKNRAENFAMLRRMALNLLKQHPLKDSIARKRKRAALDTEFLAETIIGAEEIGKI
jgi:predicted transposase YbfD/YdcC